MTARCAPWLATVRISAFGLTPVVSVNSCINFANEVLQQQFNADVFRQQQKEYEAEGIPWQSIEYQDNGPVLELIRGKRDGILTLLDEECRLQQGSPKTFVTKLTDAHGKVQALLLNHLGLSSLARISRT